ncbi:PDZK1-interacting protein 1 [Symphorus nematophorus]
MEKLPAVTSCLFLAIAAVTAQTAQTVSERPLPQWLTGIIAVSAFLFLAFVSFLVKKAWCEEPSRKTPGESVRENESMVTDRNTYETTLDMVRSKENANAYDNRVLDSTDVKVTSM